MSAVDIVVGGLVLIIGLAIAGWIQSEHIRRGGK